MKRIFRYVLTVLCLVLVLVGAAACKGPKEETPITCTIQFAKTVNEKYEAVELYEGDQFEINTKIYVIVDFTMINYGEEEDSLEFKIQIPYAKYYSTYEYNKGVIVPTEEHKDIINSDGTIEPMIELSNMVFLVKPDQTPFHYTYCFTIEANSVCENVEFKAVFISDRGIMLSHNQTFSKTYSFVAQNGGEQ